jgi:hypothetical protein
MTSARQGRLSRAFSPSPIPACPAIHRTLTAVLGVIVAAAASRDRCPLAELPLKLPHLPPLPLFGFAASLVAGLRAGRGW